MKDNVRLNKSKLHKIELYVVDPNNWYYDAEYLLDDIEVLLYKCIVKSFANNTVELDWNDDIGNNTVDASEEDFEKYFSDKRSEGMKFKITRSSIWDDEILPCSELLDKDIKLETYSDIEIRNFRGFDEFDKYMGEKKSWLSKGMNHCINKDGNIQREFPNKHKSWFLEVNNLEELMEFKNKYGEIVIREDYKNPMINVIEIYDDYRE